MVRDWYTERFPGQLASETQTTGPALRPQPAYLDDHFFDEDEVLDYLWYEEMRKEDEGDNGSGKQGCLAMLAFLVLPAVGAAGYVLFNSV